VPAGHQPPLVLDEVVLVGEHPDHPYINVIVVGSAGSDHDWATALHLAGVALSGADAAGIRDPGAVVVDARHDVVRPAKALRRIRR
jgi:hypothetical protein